MKCINKEKLSVVVDDYTLNRLDYLILKALYSVKAFKFFDGITIGEILGILDMGNGSRMTLYKKLQNLVYHQYVSKGVIDNHSDSYYLEQKGKDIAEKGE